MSAWDTLAASFRDGDILYGLDQGRGAAKTAIKNFRAEVVGEIVVFKFIRMTRHYERIIIQNDITNAVFDALEPKKPGLRSDKQIKATASVKSDPKRALEFRDFARDHPKYSVAAYSTPQSGDPTAVMDNAKSAWLKTSKAGLEFQAKRRKGFHIHFILDGLDFDRALRQDTLRGQTAQTRVHDPLDITSGEIRWLFRHRNDPDVRQSAVFWRNGVKTSPPWEMADNQHKFANFVYTKDQVLADERDSGFQPALRELKAALVIQRALRKKSGTHYVRVGESLTSIAHLYHLSVADLRTWNGLTSDEIALGDILQLGPTSPAKPAASSKPDAEPASVKSRIAAWEKRTGK